MDELMGELVRLGFLLTLWAFGIWVGGASVAAWVAWEKGRDPAAWFVMAFFLSPLVALIALSAVPARHLARVRAAQRVRGAARSRLDSSRAARARASARSSAGCGGRTGPSSTSRSSGRAACCGRRSTGSPSGFRSPGPRW